MPDPKTLKLFLVNGSPTGVVTAEIIGWTGMAVSASRTALRDLWSRDEVSRTGVYLLLGPDMQREGRQLVYVGQSDNVGRRLKEHDGDDAKNFFARVCLFVSKDENLTSAHARYLEARLIDRVDRAAGVTRSQGQAPKSDGLLPESDVADMNAFLSQIETVLPVLGFDVLRLAKEVEETDDGVGDAHPIFALTTGGTKARAREIDGAFVVLAGSLARVKETASIYPHVKRLRKQLLEDDVVAQTENGEHYEFAQNYPFDNPSIAASVVYGGSVGGPTYWKLESDPKRSYRDWSNTRND